MESGQSAAESAVYHGPCRPQAPCALFAGLPRGPGPPGKSQAHPQARSRVPPWCTPRKAAPLILMMNQVTPRTWFKKGHSWSRKPLLRKKLAESKRIPSLSRGLRIPGSWAAVTVTAVALGTAHVRRVCCPGRPGVRAAPSFQIVPREGPGDTARRGTSLARGHQLLMLSWATRPWPPAPQRGRAHWGFCRLFPSVLLRGLGTGAERGPRADGAVREGAGSPRQRTDPSIWDPVVTVPDN